MSAHTIEELRKHMETVDRYCPAQAKQINSALDELEALRAAKSEHKRTRREIRRLARFVQWEPASMVAEKENLLIENRMISENLIAITKERNGLLQANEKLTNTNRDHNDERNNTLFPRIKELCAENARLANKSNAYEDSYHAAKKAHATFTEAIAEALGVPEGETRSLVGVASELRRHANAKVNTNADVCAVEALEEMKARLEGMRETRDQATAKLADAEIERGKALHHAAVLRNDVASMTRAFEVRNARVDEVEKENTRLIRTLDAVRAAAKS